MPLYGWLAFAFGIAAYTTKDVRRGRGGGWTGCVLGAQGGGLGLGRARRPRGARAGSSDRARRARPFGASGLWGQERAGRWTASWREATIPPSRGSPDPSTYLLHPSRFQFQRSLESIKSFLNPPSKPKRLPKLRSPPHPAARCTSTLRPAPSESARAPRPGPHRQPRARACHGLARARSRARPAACCRARPSPPGSPAAPPAGTPARMQPGGPRSPIRPSAPDAPRSPAPRFHAPPHCPPPRSVNVNLRGDAEAQARRPGDLGVGGGVALLACTRLPGARPARCGAPRPRSRAPHRPRRRRARLAPVPGALPGRRPGRRRAGLAHPGRTSRASEPAPHRSRAHAPACVRRPPHVPTAPPQAEPANSGVQNASAGKHSIWWRIAQVRGACWKGGAPWGV
jgi:hypothetical protein